MTIAELRDFYGTPPQPRGAGPEPADPAAGGRIWQGEVVLAAISLPLAALDKAAVAAGLASPDDHSCEQLRHAALYAARR